MFVIHEFTMSKTYKSANFEDIFEILLDYELSLIRYSVRAFFSITELHFYRFLGSTGWIQQ